MAKRRKVKGRFYILLLLFLVAVGLLVFLLVSDRSEGTLTTGSVGLELAQDVVLIRDEEIVAVEKYDRATFRALESSSVQAGDTIAEVYKWGYTDDMTTSLLSVQRDVLAEQLALLDGVEKPDLDALMLQISTKEEEIRQAVMNGEGDLLQLERELAQLTTQRSEYLAQAVQPSTELADLYAEEELRKTQLSAWKSEVTAKEAGVVSFYFDGYEKVLCVDKLDMVNADLVSSTLQKSADYAATEGRLYRLVNDTDWYLAFVTKPSAVQRVVAGQSYSVVFDGYSGTTYLGTALEPMVGDSGVLNMLHFTQPIGALLSVRTIKASITLTADGVLAPLEALKVDGGNVVVELETGSGSKLVEVEVLASDAEHAVIRAKNPTDTVAAGMRYVAD